jgi:hypothetical protein
VALRQEVKNNARRIKTSKILRKVETEIDDRQSLRGGKRDQTCHKIPHGERSGIDSYPPFIFLH